MTSNDQPALETFSPPDTDLRNYRFMLLDVVQLANSETWAMADGWAAKALINPLYRALHQVNDQITSVERDFAMRRKAYPCWVEHGTMLPRRHDEEIRGTETDLRTLQRIDPITG